MKHVELKMLAVQAWLKTGRGRTHKISTHDNPADLVNKARTRGKKLKFGRALKLGWSHLRQADFHLAAAATTATTTAFTIFLILQLDRTTAMFRIAMDNHDQDRVRAYHRGVQQDDGWNMAITREVLAPTIKERFNLGDKMRTNFLRAECAGF